MDNENWSVAIHLGSAMAFLISLIWLWMEIRRDEDELPDWISFDPLIGMKWRKFVGILSISTLITLFSGVYVSTTPGANYGCGVDGMLGSWPLCNGKLDSKHRKLGVTIPDCSQMVSEHSGSDARILLIQDMERLPGWPKWHHSEELGLGIDCYILRKWFTGGLLRPIMGFREFLRVPVASALDGRNGIIHCSCDRLARSYSYVLSQRSEYYC